jgi:hypothetical protein
MGTAAFGSGVPGRVDVSGAIELLTSFLEELGDYDTDSEHLAPAGRLEA